MTSKLKNPSLRLIRQVVSKVGGGDGCGVVVGIRGQTMEGLPSETR